MPRPDIPARCRRVLLPLTAAAVLPWVLAIPGCDSVPDYANPAEWYRGVVGALDSEEPQTESAQAESARAEPGAGRPFPDLVAAPTPPPPPEIVPAGIARTQVGAARPSPSIVTAPAPPLPEIAPAATARAEVGVGKALPALAAPPPPPPPPEVASAAAVRIARPAAVPGVGAPFPSLATVPEPPPRETTQAELQSVAEGLVADREHARYTDEVFRREGTEAPQQALAPQPTALPPAPPQPAPPPVLAAAPPAPAVVPAVQPQRPALASAPGYGVDVTGIFSSHFSASGPYAVAPPPTATLIAYASGASAPALAVVAPLGPTSLQRQPPAPGLRSAFAPGAAVISGNSAVLYFGIGSAAISAKGRKALRTIAKAHRARGGTVRVIGHASSRTRELPFDRHNLVNFAVSLARARAVADALVRYGVAQGAVMVSAKSDNEPIYYEWMPSGEAGNRRVQVYIDF